MMKNYVEGRSHRQESRFFVTYKGKEGKQMMSKTKKKTKKKVKSY